MIYAVSHPSARIPLAGAPPHVGPSRLAAVCPKCQRFYDNTALVCPADETPLVRAADLSGAEADPMVGRTLDGRFTILAKLGAGSMGTVYRARQHAIGRDVAIKILRSDRATDATAKARFLREARANSLLASPHTVTVFDFGQGESGEFYLAMELLEGESVGQRLAQRRRLPVDIAVETTRQALRSLAEAHAKGIVHRDLKPDNLFYARVRQGDHDAQVEEIVKVLDFGIAKMISTADDAMPMNAVETQAGTVFGTPRYMSPEQAQGKPLDARSDLYSLGVILYQMLTGRPPFTDNDAIVVMARHIKTAPKSAIEACPEANIPPELDLALLRALAKEPKQRPATAEQMSAELARALDLLATVSSGVRSVRPPPPPGAPGHALSGIEDPDSNLPEPALPRRRGVIATALVAFAVAAAIATAILVVPRRANLPTLPRPTLLTSSRPTQLPPAAPVSVAPSDRTSLPPGPASTRETPTVSAESLPKATRTPGSGSKSRPPPAASQGARSPTAAAAPPAKLAPPPTSASSRYGIFE